MGNPEQRDPTPKPEETLGTAEGVMLSRAQVEHLLTRGGRKTSDEEIANFLVEYARGVPVMPVTFVCNFLEQWAELYAADCEETYPGQKKEREDLAQKIQHVFLQIRKSNLLSRTIYGGEKPRTQPCPEHKGHWSGCTPKEETACKGACQDQDEFNVTGWLREPKEG